MTNRIKSIYIVIIILSTFFVSCDDSTPVAASEDHFEAAGFVIKNEAGDIVFKEVKGQADPSVTGTFSILLSKGSQNFSVEFLDENGKNLGVPQENDHSLSFEVDNNTPIDIKTNKWNFTLIPYKAASMKFRVLILHVDHPDFTSPYFDVEIK